jgi:Ran-binding protein 1
MAEEDENGYAQEEEAQVEFKALVTLDEVKTATLEEDEEVAFKMRAKLFRWESDSWEKEVKMWKERGTGDVKFLKHKESGKVRMLMRREKTMKICANFHVSHTIELKVNAGSDRSWVWQCVDFSEEKDEVSVLAIRFANSDNAQKFKEEFDKGKAANAAAGGETPAKAATPKADGDAPKSAEKATEGDAKADEAAAAIDKVKIGDKEGEKAEEKKE